MMSELMKETEKGGLSFHPMQEAIKLYRETDDDKVKVSLLKEMLSFGNDKQHVEVEVAETENITQEDRIALYKAIQEQLKGLVD
jgi:hypothetical protein